MQKHSELLSPHVASGTSKILPLFPDIFPYHLLSTGRLISTRAFASGPGHEKAQSTPNLPKRPHERKPAWRKTARLLLRARRRETLAHAASCPHSLIGIVHFFDAFRIARHSILSIASSAQNAERFFAAFLSWQLSDSAAFVAYIARRISGGRLKNSRRSSQWRSQHRKMAGHLESRFSPNPASATRLASSVAAEYIAFKSARAFFKFLYDANLAELRAMRTMQS